MFPHYHHPILLEIFARAATLWLKSTANTQFTVKTMYNGDLLKKKYRIAATFSETRLFLNQSNDCLGKNNAIKLTLALLPQSQRSVTVQGLQANSVYQLQLQVLTTGGSNGAAVSKTIHTPAIKAKL